MPRGLRRGLGALAIVAAALSAGAASLAQPPSDSVSLGTTHDGRLEDAVALPFRGDGFHWETNRGNADARYGTAELVGALTRAAAAVARAHPGSDLVVHDLSRPDGGPVRGHRSHRSGRDADVGYYALDGDGAPMNPTVSIWFTRSGRARAGRATFDGERNALLLRELLADRAIEVQQVFMARHLQRRVVSATPRRLRDRLRRVLRTPRGRRVDPHADHLHLRIRCPRGDRPRCRER